MNDYSFSLLKGTTEVPKKSIKIRKFCVIFLSEKRKKDSQIFANP